MESSYVGECELAVEGCKVSPADLERGAPRLGPPPPPPLSSP